MARADAITAGNVMGSLYIKRFMGNVNIGNNAKIDWAMAAGNI